MNRLAALSRAYPSAPPNMRQTRATITVTPRKPSSTTCQGSFVTGCSSAAAYEPPMIATLPITTGISAERIPTLSSA